MTDRFLTPEQLITGGMATLDMIDFLMNCVIVRKNIIVSGDAGSGKTTFLNVLAGFVSHNERIITVEQKAEMRLVQDHWVRLECRLPDNYGKGGISMGDLIRNCLRMRPDRVIVDECRGAEALEMLRAMKAGCDGSLASIQANSPADALERLSALCLSTEIYLQPSALVEMISSAVHLVVHLTCSLDGSRRVGAVTEVTGKKGIMVKQQDIFLFQEAGVTAEGRAQGDFSACGNVPTFWYAFGDKGRVVPLRMFQSWEQKVKGIIPRPPERGGSQPGNEY